MSTFNGIPALALPGTISTTPANSGTTLPWNGSAKFYQWSLTLAITHQLTSGVNTRQKLQYNGLDVNVGMWIGNVSSGLAWQIASISAKTAASVTCVVTDVFRYNTYRDPSQSGNGKPGTGSYIIFQLSEAGLPVIDPAPGSIGATFLSTAISRFQYINNQNDFLLTQVGIPGPLATVYFGGGGTTSPGSGYVTGVYTSVPLLGGSGSGAQATIEVGPTGTVVSLTVTSIGSGYVVTSPASPSNPITVNNINLGGTGSGFSGGVSSNFFFGDVIALDEATGTYVKSDGTHLNVIGTVTAVDDTGTNIAIIGIQKIVDTLNYLPGVVGDLIYTDPNNPGGLTTTVGGTQVYLKLRNQTASTTQSSTFGSATSTITTAGNTFNVNGILAVVGGTGTLTDVRNAINTISSVTGVSAVIGGSFFLTITAVDARQIGFEDIIGSTTTNVGLISVENGIKAAGMFITNSRQSASFSSVIGFTFTQAVANLTWNIAHNSNTLNYIAQIFDNTGNGNAILPDTITTIDVNNVQITFSNAQAGKAQLSLFVPNPV